LNLWSCLFDYFLLQLALKSNVQVSIILSALGHLVLVGWLWGKAWGLRQTQARMVLKMACSSFYHSLAALVCSPFKFKLRGN
jgi:hypothetical protein